MYVETFEWSAPEPGHEDALTGQWRVLALRLDGTLCGEALHHHQYASDESTPEATGCVHHLVEAIQHVGGAHGDVWPSVGQLGWDE